VHTFGYNWYFLWFVKFHFNWCNKHFSKAIEKVRFAQPGSKIVLAVPKSYHKFKNEINGAKVMVFKTEIKYEFN
jgi:hypothetical protein